MLLTTKNLKDYKQELYQEQAGICPVCQKALNQDVQSNHLDHDHALEGAQAGRVRGLLHPLCNVLEGRIRHQYQRSGIASHTDYLETLESLIRYLRQDHTKNAIHPQLVPDLKKRFARLDKTSMIAELDQRGIIYKKDDTRAELVKLYNSKIKQTLNTST